MNNVFPNRSKAILIGLYLSKFDEQALTALGFDGFKQAFNAMGYAIGIKPDSIKNYRDEFDPKFPNARQGWHNRPMKDNCKKVYDKYSSLEIESFTELVKSLVIQNYDIEKIIAKVEKRDMTDSIAKRLITGKAAEEYFKSTYQKLQEFSTYDLMNTTNMACGFDFKLSQNSNFYCVEVKGLNAASGSIMMTEKEFRAAGELRQQYCLFVVSNFAKVPQHQMFFEPLNSRLSFKKNENIVKQINYSTSL